MSRPWHEQAEGRKPKPATKTALTVQLSVQSVDALAVGVDDDAGW